MQNIGVSPSPAKRRFTNSAGETVEVTQQHLDTAVEIKLQLQELSPSRKTSWKKHKEMMEAEGIFDSDVNESYRCMIKDYQRSISKLPSLEKHADLVAESKIQVIQEAVGELYYQKREVMEKASQLGRLKRDLVKVAVVAEEVRNAFVDEINFVLPEYACQPRLIEGSKRGILILTDWHVGATVDNVFGNSYNYEIAKKRMNLLKQKTVEYCQLYGIKDLDVICLGDMVENVAMRINNQAFEAEFNYSKQIVKASELIIDLLVSMSKFYNVEYGGIAGNHDRIFSKESNIDGDNAMVIVNEAVHSFIRLSQMPRLSYAQADEILYSYKKEYNGSKIKFVHGDNDSKADGNKLAKHMSMDEEVIDALVMGHYHHFNLIERNYGKLELIVGSPMGRNNYSAKIKATSDASQGFIVVHEDGEIQPIRVGLQVV